MSSRLRRLFALPVFEDEGKVQVARLLNVVLLTFGAAVALVLVAIVALFGAPADMTEWTTLLSAIGALIVTAVLLVLARFGFLRLVSIVFLSLMWLFITVWIGTVAGLVSDTSLLAYPLIIVLAGLLLGGRAAIAFTAISVLAAAGVFYLEVAGLLVVEERALTIMDPIMAAIPLALTGLLLRFAIDSMNRALVSARENERAQVQANSELDLIRASLEERVVERTAELERRSIYLEAAAEVGRAATSILETDRLMAHVAELVQQRFGLYHVGMFLLDGTGRWAEYRAGAGEGKEDLLDSQFRLEIDGSSMVGWCMAHAQVRVAQNVSLELHRVAHPLVPATRSEAALPLIARGTVLGAFSVQSDMPGAFGPDTVTALQGLADQVAVALDNARLFSEATAALEAERRAYGEFSREAWLELLRGRPDWGYRCGPRGTVSTVQSRWRPGMIQAGQSGETVRTGDLEVSVPIKVQDQVAGIVRLRKPDGSLPWSQGEMVMMESLVSQLGLTLESARLHDESQRRAASDRLLAETSARIRETLDLDTVLQTAVREIRQAMGLRDVTIRMGDDSRGRDDASWKEVS